MTLLAAAVFAIIRYGLALVPWLALNWPLKKIAAAAALVAGAAYLAISGADVPTQRAYVMTATVLVAVLLDRPALTMRAIALAALIVLVVAPESLVQAGFQMSFAATIALVAGFEALRGAVLVAGDPDRPRAGASRKPVLGVAMTSLVAGAATAPISAFHFNTIVPVRAAREPAGGAGDGGGGDARRGASRCSPCRSGSTGCRSRWSGWGMGYVLAVAEFVAGLGGAVIGRACRAGRQPGADLRSAALFVVLWSGRGRWAGLAPVGARRGALGRARRARTMLIADTGRLFGFATEAGRVLSSETGNGFAAATLAGERRRHREPGRGLGARRACSAAATGSRRGAGARAGALRRQQGRGGRGGRLRRATPILIAPNWADRRPRAPASSSARERLRREGALAIDRRRPRA